MPSSSMTSALATASRLGPEPEVLQLRTHRHRRSATGLLNATVKPGRYPLGSSGATMSAKDVQKKGKSTGSSVTTFRVPMGLLAQYSVEHNAHRGLTYAVPFEDDRYEVTAAATNYDFDVFLDLTRRA